MNEKNNSARRTSQQMILGGCVCEFFSFVGNASDDIKAAGIIVGAIFFVGGIMLKERSR